MANTIDLTQRHGLCVGCGLCAAVCPEQAIAMNWDRSLIWVPQIDMMKCTDCGLCVKVCPNTPECISEYALAAANAGERFGLQEEARCFIAHDQDSEKRIRSASGGALTAILMHLLSSGEVDGVIASVPVMAPMGEPHYEIRVMRSIEELDQARSSHYHPLCYDKAVTEIGQDGGRYALVGVPCIIRGVRRLPEKFQNKIRYTFGLACSKNVTAQFLDCLARQVGIREGEPFTANQRDKFGGIPNAHSYNTYFLLPNREIRRSRFETFWTSMWRNYFFTPECCLYCPDFYAADADLSVKDAWGRLSSDPLGTSLLLVRNPELVAPLQELAGYGRLYLKPCDANEVFLSQVPTPRFKHIEVRDRVAWKPPIRRVLLKMSYPLGTSRRWWKGSSLIYWQFRTMMRLSSFFYTHWGRVPVRGISAAVRPISFGSEFVKSRLAIPRYRRLALPLYKGFEICVCFPQLLARCVTRCRYFYIHPPERQKRAETLQVLISGGYGYQNAGDEAQLGANISKWKRLCPNVNLTILSPDPAYTEREHGEHAELAPRVVFFDSNRRRDYGASNIPFKLQFAVIAPLMLFNARFFRSGLPLIGISQREVHLLTLIYNADVLHLSGGGYLTGVTLSRLWDNMLLIRLADVLGTPVILSGQTIGIFRDRVSRKLARWGLKKAKLIYLRDSWESMADLHSIGIDGKHIKATFDDALFCDEANEKEVDDCLLKNGVDIGIPYAVVNVWMHSGPGQITRRMTQVCDYIVAKHKLQIVFVPTSPGDVPWVQSVHGQMSEESRVIYCDFNYKIIKGIIGKAELCLTFKHHPIIFAMACGVPTISIIAGRGGWQVYFGAKNRGALELFGQEKWLIDEKDLIAADLVESVIDRCLTDRQELSATIQARLADYRDRDGEAILSFLSGARQ